MQRKRTWAVLGLVGGLVTLGLGARVGRASGIPKTEPLYYGGYLEENGTPIDGARSITVDVWNDATSTATAGLVCRTIAPTSPVVKGRFRVALDASCPQGLRDNADTWIDVSVGAISLGRAKVGAVPYAVEADRASKATGDLAQQIVPAGAVVAFELGACPAGWTALAAAQGRTIVGSGGALALDATVGSDQTTLTVEQMPPHNHPASDSGHKHQVPNTINYNIAPTFALGGQGIGQQTVDTSVGFAQIAIGPTGGGQAFDNRQASLGLLYCKKN